MVEVDRKQRSERVMRVLLMITGVMLAVGLVSLGVSYIGVSGTKQGPPAPTPTDYKALTQEARQRARFERDKQKWAEAVGKVCAHGQVAFPALKYGMGARPEDMHVAVGRLMKDLSAVGPRPSNPPDLAEIESKIKQGEELQKVWDSYATRPPHSVPTPEWAGEVDRLRTYMQDLVDRGAKQCEPLIPSPNPTWATALPAPAPAPAPVISPSPTP